MSSLILGSNVSIDSVIESRMVHAMTQEKVFLPKYITLHAVPILNRTRGTLSLSLGYLHYLLTISNISVELL